jgi:uncharacterized protein YjiS (DUF1127 family)
LVVRRSWRWTANGQNSIWRPSSCSSDDTLEAGALCSGLSELSFERNFAMLPWNLIAQRPVAPLGTTLRVFRNVEGHALQRVAGSVEGMSDHQLRDIGLSRCVTANGFVVAQSVILASGTFDVDTTKRDARRRSGYAMVQAWVRWLSVRQMLNVLSVWRNRMVDRQTLAMMDDRDLQDMNVTRSDVYIEASKPFWRE